MSDQRKSRAFRIELSETEQRAEAARTVRFNAWLAECAEIQDTVIESLLANLPSFNN